MKKIIFSAAILLLSICFYGCDSERYRAEEKFAAIQKSLMAAVDDLTKIPPQIEAANEPSVKGKIAVFNKGKIVTSGAKDADGKSYFMTPLYFREMEEFYASAPGEVGTVAIVNCETLKKGVYKTEDGKEYPAEVEDCELTMIDRAKQAVVFKRKFEKTPSQERKAYGNSVIRQSAQEDVLQFLKGLPRN